MLMRNERNWGKEERVVSTVIFFFLFLLASHLLWQCDVPTTGLRTVGAKCKERRKESKLGLLKPAPMSDYSAPTSLSGTLEVLG